MLTSGYHVVTMSPAAFKPMHPPAARENLSVAEAETEIARCMPGLPVERVALDAAAGRILREAVNANRDQPAFDRVTMDGIAFAFEDWQQGIVEFPIAGIQAAGRPPLSRTQPGHCFEVMTGAVLPRDCDCVAPVEEVILANGVARLAPGANPRRMQYVHRRGSDYVDGARLLEPGMLLRGPELAVLASAGRTQVSVASQPRIAIITTGDELVAVDAAIEEHEVRRSNDRAMAAALRLRGITQVDRAHVPDNPERLRQAIGELLEDHSVLILSGGVSMGKFDHVPQALADLGVAVIFHKVRQRPGKPMWFGIGGGGQVVFALPGNPVSSLVCLHRFVLPALEAAAGAKPAVRLTVRLARQVEFEPALTWFLPVRIERNLVEAQAEPVFTNTSGDFARLAGSDGFVELPAVQQRFAAGYAAPLYCW